MKKYYSIGETAEIMSISTQALRNYANLHIITPQYVSPETGYRYYSFNQFYDIDRLIYLRKMGISLRDIADILHTGTIEKLVHYLTKQQDVVHKQIRELQDSADEIAVYLNHYQYLNRIHLLNVPYVRHISSRYVLYAMCDDIKERVETRIIRLKNKKKYAYRRQWGFIADYAEYLQDKFSPLQEFIVLKEQPVEDDTTYICEIPGGLYLCSWGTQHNINATLVASFYQGCCKPPYVVALLFEDNLKNFGDCSYEFQLLIRADEE